MGTTLRERKAPATDPVIVTTVIPSFGGGSFTAKCHFQICYFMASVPYGEELLPMLNYTDDANDANDGNIRGTIFDIGLYPVKFDLNLKNTF